MADRDKAGQRRHGHVGLLLSRAFGRGQITAIRHAVARCAEHTGLAGPRLEDFVLAVNEIVTNAVEHAGGAGHVRLWLRDGALLCEVSDRGPGIPAERIDPPHLPPAFAASGRGLWLARRLCDTAVVRSGPSGTIVRLAAALT